MSPLGITATLLALIALAAGKFLKAILITWSKTNVKTLNPKYQILNAKHNYGKSVHFVQFFNHFFFQICWLFFISQNSMNYTAEFLILILQGYINRCGFTSLGKPTLIQLLGRITYLRQNNNFKGFVRNIEVKVPYKLKSLLKKYFRASWASSSSRWFPKILLQKF